MHTAATVEEDLLSIPKSRTYRLYGRHIASLCGKHSIMVRSRHDNIFLRKVREEKLCQDLPATRTVDNRSCTNLVVRAATKLFATSHSIGWENVIQTIVAMELSPKTIEFRANMIQ